MGFGLLLIGYFLAFITSLRGSYLLFADVIGSAIIVYSLSKLSAYSDKFKRSVPSSIIFTLISFVGAVASILKAGEIVLQIISTARAAASLMLLVYVLSAIEDMAKGAEDLRLAGKARRNLSVVCVYYFMFVMVSMLEPLFDERLTGYFTVIIYLFGIIVHVMNMLHIHSAYARLYIEGTEERYAETAQFKKSRFKFINTIHEKYAASQKKANEENYELMKQTRDYVNANRDKIPNKKKKKK